MEPEINPAADCDLSRDEREHLVRRVGAEGQAGDVAHDARGDERSGHLFMMGDADLFERMGEGIVPHIVQQRRGPHDLLLPDGDLRERPAFLEQTQRQPRQMPGTQCMLETGMRGAGVDEKCQPQLPHIPQTLQHGRFQQRQRQRVEPDVVPERIAQNFHPEK